MSLELGTRCVQSFWAWMKTSHVFLSAQPSLKRRMVTWLRRRCVSGISAVKLNTNRVAWDLFVWKGCHSVCTWTLQNCSLASGDGSVELQNDSCFDLRCVSNGSGSLVWSIKWLVGYFALIADKMGLSGCHTMKYWSSVSVPLFASLYGHDTCAAYISSDCNSVQLACRHMCLSMRRSSTRFSWSRLCRIAGCKRGSIIVSVCGWIPVVAASEFLSSSSECVVC